MVGAVALEFLVAGPPNAVYVEGYLESEIPSKITEM
jgi:hypothetical protein